VTCARGEGMWVLEGMQGPCCPSNRLHQFGKSTKRDGAVSSLWQAPSEREDLDPRGYPRNEDSRWERAHLLGVSCGFRSGAEGSLFWSKMRKRERMSLSDKALSLSLCARSRSICTNSPRCIRVHARCAFRLSASGFGASHFGLRGSFGVQSPGLRVERSGFADWGLGRCGVEGFGTWGVETWM
jgi:hypothetical protein